MKNVWKWILGIVVVLLVVGVIVAVPYIMHSVWGTSYGPGMMQGFEGRSWRMPMHDFGGRGFDQFGPMMGGRGFGGVSLFFGGFMLLGGLLRLLVPLGVVALIVWFAYQQGKKAGFKSASAPAPVPEEPAP